MRGLTATSTRSVKLAGGQLFQQKQWLRCCRNCLLLQLSHGITRMRLVRLAFLSPPLPGPWIGSLPSMVRVIASMSAPGFFFFFFSSRQLWSARFPAAERGRFFPTLSLFGLTGTRLDACSFLQQNSSGGRSLV